MNHTVEINTYRSPIRDQRHKEYAGEITENSFGTYENKNPKIWFTRVECREFERFKKERDAKLNAAEKGER